MPRLKHKADQSQGYSRRRNGLQKTYDSLPQQTQLNQQTHFSNNILTYTHTEKHHQTLPKKDTEFSRHALVEDYFYDRSGNYLDDDCAITEDNFNNETQERFDENEHINSDERY